MGEPLFVYGTLRRGRAPAHLAFMDALERRSATVSGRLLDLGDYPGWVPDEACEDRVRGELLEIDPVHWPVLDRYEGHRPDDADGSLFVRERVVVCGEDGDVPCWIYRYNGPVAGVPIVVGGDWLAGLA